MQRYFLPPDAREGHTARIRGADFHHVTRVMRMRLGAQVEVVVEGEVWLADLIEVQQDLETAVVKLHTPLQDSRESAHTLVLLQGLAKGDKLDQIIRQACEIGVSQIFLFHSARSIVEIAPDKLAARLERFRKIAKEACEQAHRDRVVEVMYCSEMVEAVDSFWRLGTSEEGMLLMPYESQSEQLPSLRSVLRGECATDASDCSPIQRIGIAIGPEGGFTEAEVAYMRTTGGVPLTLGPRILRTETAGIVAAAIVLHEWGEMELTTSGGKGSE